MFCAGGKEFRSFREAVAASSPGSTLHLPEGVVELGPGVRIERSLRLVGQGIGRTVLRGPAWCLHFRGGSDATWTLQGLTVETASEDLGLCAGGEGALRLEDCEILARTLAVSVKGRVTASFVGCRVSGGGCGVQVGDDARLFLSGTEVFGNVGLGLSVEDRSGCQVTDSRFSDNGFGAVLGSEGPCSVTDSVFERNRSCGILVDGACEARLEGNHCRHNAGCGIVFCGRSGGGAQRNLCETNHTGIQVLQEARPVLVENRLLRNETCGLQYMDSSGGVARLSVCEGNGQCGILVEERAAPVLSENACTGGLSGIVVRDRARPRLLRNECSANRDGIALLGGDADLDGNVCEGNSSAGIWCAAGRGALRNNRLSGNRVPIYVSHEGRHRVGDPVTLFLAAERLPERKSELPGRGVEPLPDLLARLRQVHVDRLAARAGDTEALQRLTAALGHEVRSVRTDAAWALGTVGVRGLPAFLPLLWLAMEDPWPEVRAAAVRALARSCPNMEEDLLWDLCGAGMTRESNIAAMELFGRAGGENAWFLLYEFASTSDPEMRLRAVQVLVGEYFPAMLRADAAGYAALAATMARNNRIGDRYRDMASVILASMEVDRAESHLRDLLHDTDGVPLAALSVLEYLAPARAEALDLLFQSLERPAMAAEVISALLRLGC